MSEVPLYLSVLLRHSPLSSELGTYKTVKARLWSWLEPFSGRSLEKTFKVFPFRSPADVAPPSWSRCTLHRELCTMNATLSTLHCVHPDYESICP